MLQPSISSPCAFQMSPARRRMADRSVCGSAAQAGWAAAAAVAAAATSAGEAMPTRPGSAPVGGPVSGGPAPDVGRGGDAAPAEFGAGGWLSDRGLAAGDRRPAAAEGLAAPRRLVEKCHG